MVIDILRSAFLVKKILLNETSYQFKASRSNIDPSNVKKNVGNSSLYNCS